MVNAVFGLETIQNKLDIRLVSKVSRVEKLIAKCNFLDRYNENLVGIRMAKTNIVLNKPIYLGQCILYTNKMHMYHFHYDIIFPKYRVDKLRLLYTLTYSFIYEIKTPHLYKDMEQNTSHFDTSNYPTNHPLY